MKCNEQNPAAAQKRLRKFTGRAGKQNLWNSLTWLFWITCFKKYLINCNFAPHLLIFRKILPKYIMLIFWLEIVASLSNLIASMENRNCLNNLGEVAFFPSCYCSLNYTARKIFMLLYKLSVVVGEPCYQKVCKDQNWQQNEATRNENSLVGS